MIRNSAALLVLALVAPTFAGDGEPRAQREDADWVPAATVPLSEDKRPWIPMRIRDLTLPGAISMGFIPSSTSALGKGQLAFELHYSRTNNFIASERVEEFLEDRGLMGSPLSDADIQGILALPGDNYLLDGEFGLWQFVTHWGVSDRGSLSLSIPRLGYSGGYLDNAIEGFHDTFSFSQAGAEYLPQDLFQVLFDFKSSEGPPLVLQQRPTDGGIGDPTLEYHYSVPTFKSGWQMAFNVGAKFALADTDKFLSTGSNDYGGQVSIGKGWNRYGVLFNVSYVNLGRFDQGLEPADVYSVHATGMRYYGSRTIGFLQLFSGDNLFGDVTTTEFGEIEFQISAGLKWFVRRGYLGFGLTENLFNFDNTPDISLHLMTGFFVTGRHKRNDAKP